MENLHLIEKKIAEIKKLKTDNENIQKFIDSTTKEYASSPLVGFTYKEGRNTEQFQIKVAISVTEEALEKQLEHNQQAITALSDEIVALIQPDDTPEPPSEPSEGDLSDVDDVDDVFPAEE